MQVIREDTKLKFVKDKVIKVPECKENKKTSEKKKKGSKFPTNLRKQNFKNTPNKKGENSKGGKT